MTAARHHADTSPARKGLMSTSEFPPPPKSVRLFPVPVLSEAEVRAQVGTCMATQQSPPKRRLKVFTWLAITAVFAVVLVLSGALQRVLEFIAQLLGQPSN